MLRCHYRLSGNQSNEVTNSLIKRNRSITMGVHIFSIVCLPLKLLTPSKIFYIQEVLTSKRVSRLTHSLTSTIYNLESSFCVLIIYHLSQSMGSCKLSLLGKQNNRTRQFIQRTSKRNQEARRSTHENSCQGNEVSNYFLGCWSLPPFLSSWSIYTSLYAIVKKNLPLG